MTDRDPHPDSAPQADNDTRSDIEQAVEAREDAVERGEGGEQIDAFTSPGMADGVGGTGGVVKNQEADAQ